MLTIADARLSMKKEFQNELTFDSDLRRAQTRVNQKRFNTNPNSPLFKDVELKFDEMPSSS